MALPVWQSLDSIVGTMAINFVSRLDQADIVPGLEDLKAGSPFLAIFQAVGQSRMRDQQQNMEVLDANDIDSPEADLDRIGAKEQIPRLGQTFSRGTVDIGDDSFQKVSSKLYHGTPAPIPGTTVLYVVDASSFPSTGQLYIGRGTTNFEGPLSYTARTNLGPNWSITLSSGTTNFHALTEVVSLAQGGDRTVAAGQVVRTPAGGNASPVTFATVQTIVVPDGEVLFQGVTVVCQNPGAVGNVPKGAIKDVVAPAFTGMTVTNPLAIQNGRDTESDVDYRARIKAIKAGRMLGTRTAVETFATGVGSPDENSVVSTATLVRRRLYPTLLTIDDGSGYEEKTEGINYEVLVDSANGGETTFQLTYGRPVAKASVMTILTAPYSIEAGSILAVLVGGERFEHSFITDDFRNIGNATAFEVVASINADANLSFSARTANGGSQVVIFAKAETNDDVQVTTPFSGVDANTFLNFPTGRYDTLRLYKNDRLLQKDGLAAILTSQAQGSWSAMSSGETLIISLDGTTAITYTINDVDFVNAGTGFNTVAAQNSLNAWAAVFNAKLPGITTTVNGSFLEMTSNKGLSASASIVLDPTSTLVVKGMFSATGLSATGRDFDYVLDRNVGQVELTEPLQAEDRLTAGTPFTRAYIESGELAASVTIAAGDANLWFFVDGDAATIPTGLNGSVRLAPTTTAGDPNVKITAQDAVTFLAVNGVFSGLKVGDWYIQTATGAPLGVAGAWRISEVDTLGSWFKVEIPWASYTLTNSTGTVFGYTAFARAAPEIQRVTIPAGSYTPAQLAAAATPIGASYSVVDSRIRLATDTFDVTGDIALVAQDTNALQLQLPLGLVVNNEPHTASVECEDGEVGTPNFNVRGVSTYAGSTLTATGALLPDYKQGLIDQILFVRPLLSGVINSRFSTLNGIHLPVKAITSTSSFDVTLPTNTVITNAAFTNAEDYLVGCSLYRFGPQSLLNVTMNQDPVGAGFSVPVYRRLIADPTVPYGTTLRLKDQDLLTGGLPSTLDKAFGQPNFNFANFALHAHARGITHPADSSKKILWRKNDYVGSMVDAYVQYGLPAAPATGVALSQTEPTGTVVISLPSGAARAVTLTPGSIVRHVNAQDAVISAYGISSITRAGGNTVTATLTAPFGITPGTGMATNDVVEVNITSANFTSGPKTITATGASTITWVEAGANVTEAPTGAWVAWATSPVDFTAVQVNDVTSGWVGYFDVSGTAVAQIKTVAQYGVQFWTDIATTDANETIATASDFVFYPISSTTSGTTANLTATLLVSQVNALSGIVSGTVLGTGSGIISQSYPTDSAARALLADGILQILSSSWNGVAGNYTLTLKWAPSADLTATPNDYANETFRLVPTTVKNVVDFLGTPAVTGLGLGGSVLARTGHHLAEHVQISSTTLGSDGAVQVTGGNANDLRLSVVGPASAVSGFLKVPVRTTTDLATLPTMDWALIHTSQTIAKTLNWAAASTIQFFTTNSKVVVSGAGATAWAHTAATITSGRWYVEKQGRFVAYTVQGAGGQLASLGAGNWVVLAGGTASLANLGTFRVIQTMGNTFWVENPDFVTEDVTIGTARFYTYDSVMPGDIFSVGTNAFGNQGLWVVSANDDGNGNDTGTFYVTGVLTNSGPTAFSTDLSFFKVLPSTPTTSFGRIRCAITELTDPTITNLYLDYIDTTRPELVGSSTGAKVQSLDRLEFSTDIVTGQDGYVHDIGLIAAVNQVIYGDESDPETYPGVVSAGDDIFIGPPLIRRVFISVAVREVSGSNTTPGVQAAIAKIINSAGGKPVPISSYIAEAQAVPGVVSIIPLDPVPVEGADTIPVQPGERASILDIDNDIQVNIIGQ